MALPNLKAEKSVTHGLPFSQVEGIAIAASQGGTVRRRRRASTRQARIAGKLVKPFRLHAIFVGFHGKHKLILPLGQTPSSKAWPKSAMPGLLPLLRFATGGRRADPKSPAWNYGLDLLLEPPLAIPLLTTVATSGEASPLLLPPLSSGLSASGSSEEGFADAAS